MDVRAYDCVFCSERPALNGQLVGGPWERAAWSESFVDIRGQEWPDQPWFDTRFKMLWDDHCLYVGAWLEEPYPWATLTERESVIFQDNDFELFLDPDGDAKRYFEIEVNAFGTVWDLYLETPYRDGGSADNSWDVQDLELVTHVDGFLNDSTRRSKGWSVTIALPWHNFERGGMRCPPRRGDAWRMNFSRVQWHVDAELKKLPGRAEENWVWSPQYQVDMHQPEYWGVVRFVGD